MRKWLNKLLDLLFPRRACCLGCGDLMGNEQDDYLCNACLARREEIRGLYVPRQLNQSLIRRAFAPYPYAQPIKGMVRALKFSSQTELAIPLAADIARLMREYDFKGYDCIVPVPLHPMREYDRGYNQSLLLAQELGRQLHLPVEKLLRRKRLTKQQALLSTAERRRNLRAAFECSASCRDLRILLIDDVMTTGSTMYACAEALLAQGAWSVEVCSIAMARGKKYSQQ